MPKFISEPLIFIQGTAITLNVAHTHLAEYLQLVGKTLFEHAPLFAFAQHSVVVHFNFIRLDLDLLILAV